MVLNGQLAAVLERPPRQVKETRKYDYGEYRRPVPYTCSPALLRWKTDRADALNTLVTVHSTVTGRRRGRQYGTEQLNYALFVSLASEFQGYCRDLHDDAIFAMTNAMAQAGDPSLEVVRTAMILSRKLDKGNAQPSSLGSDFKILGMTFWEDMAMRYPVQKPRWHGFLTDLNETRNAIAHRDTAKLVIAKVKQPLTLATFKRWRATLNAVTAGIDNAVHAYLQRTVGSSW